MGFRCGIVGLPNVGKSSLFNVLTAGDHSEVAPFAFSTKTPHLGEIIVPEPRLEQIRAIALPERIQPARLPLVDIAGLIRGAANGEGLGNQFLAHIREVEMIIHVLRCFDDDGLAHFEGELDPVRDAQIVELELLLADLEMMERRLTKSSYRQTGSGKRLQLIERVVEGLRAGQPARMLELNPKQLSELGLLTAKPVLYVGNVGERELGGNSHTESLIRWVASRPLPASQSLTDQFLTAQSAVVVVPVAAEAELIHLSPKERDDYRNLAGLQDTGIRKVVSCALEQLGYLTFFTVNAKQAQAWLLEQGSSALEAAARVHSDFAAGFIRAETVSCQDFVTLGGIKPCSQAGRVHLEGRDYQVQDGDILQFRFRKTA